MSRSLFSERHSDKRRQFYEKYELMREHFPNLPHYERPVEPTKELKRVRKHTKVKAKDYDYDDWIAGDFIPIVVRRRIEEQTNTQLMARHTPNPLETFSYRSWPSEEPQLEEGPTGELRRSSRLIAKSRFKLDKIVEVNEAAVDQDEEVDPQQRATPPTVEGPSLPFPCPIDTCPLGFMVEAALQQHQLAMGHHQWELQCQMCGKYFSCQLLQDSHTLDECRIHLLASLRS